MKAFKNLKFPSVGPDINSILPFSEDFMLEGFIRQLLTGQSSMLEDQVRRSTKAESKKKCEKIANQHYVKGKAALAKNNALDYLEAVHEFTGSLLYAPATSNQIVSYYIDRSLALQKIKALNEAMEDIQRALKLSVDEEQKTKLLARKGIIKSLIANTGLQNLELRKSCEETEKEVLTYGENKEVVGVSSAMDLAYNDKFGRHYIATQDIKIGDVLMIQQPFVCVPNPKTIDNSPINHGICDNCLKLTLNPIPCQSCALSMYCGEECQRKAYEKFHRMECLVLQRYYLLTGSETLPLRALIIAAKQGEKIQEVFKLMDKVNNNKDKRTNGFHEGKLDGTKAESILSLLTHRASYNQAQHPLNAAFAAYILKENGFLKGCNNYENTVKLGKLFLQLSYACQMNMYGVRGRHFNHKIALAMYPVFNFLNNSCASNTLWYDRKGLKILRACRNIKKGEQVCVSYLTFAVIYKTAAERKQFFKKFKFFDCQCDACKNNYDFKLELKQRLKLSPRLKKRIMNKPNDTISLWEVLTLIVNNYDRPCLEAKTVEFALVNAHMGSDNKDILDDLKKTKLF